VQRSAYEQHLSAPHGRAPAPDGALIGAAGGSACGDLIRIALTIESGRVQEATFDAEGCGALIACGSICVELAEQTSALELARVGAPEVAERLGGLSPAKLHAAQLAADALHRALTLHWRALVDQEVTAPRKGGRVLVAMSGGVDSAVAALLAKRAGHEVVAVTLKLWADQVGDQERSCCSPAAVLGARALAHSMGLPHLTLDMEDAFRAAVVDDFIAGYSAGRTPNPCVRCNGRVRFDSMLALAGALGADRLVTGHYARITSDGSGPLLGPADDPNKDQAYMLAALDPALLERIEFPLAGLTKPQVRALAGEAGLPVASKPESQDLCFMAGTDRASFLARHGDVARRAGEIVDLEGAVVGSHDGHSDYTVGQRRGLGVASEQPLYVIDTDAERNRVVVGPHAALATRTVRVVSASLYREAGRVAAVKLRYRSEPLGCSVVGDLEPGLHDALELELERDAHGVAAGQVACFYDAEQRLVGHGVIESAPRPAAALA
jgi:tRNA-specific 2-thiouridylase